MTGCDLPDSYYAYDISTEKSTLFIPPIEPESVIWSGLPLSKDEALSLYDVDSVLTTDEVPAFLAQSRFSSSDVWAIAKQVSDHVTFLAFKDSDFTLLKTAIEECRVVKDDFEIALTKKANAISTIAHTAVLKAVKHAKNERELEGLFIERCIANGAREQAYHSIVASGTAAATLHYVKNNEPLKGKLNLLLDAGAELDCYASDIVRHCGWRQESRLISVIDKNLSHFRLFLSRKQSYLRYRPPNATRLYQHAQRRSSLG